MALAPRQVRPEGGTSLTEGEVAELRRLLVASAGLNPGALTAEDHFLRGNSYHLSGQYQEALADFNRALALRPDHPDRLHGRCIALHLLGRLDEALADFNLVLALRPDDPGTLYNRGVALGRLGRHDEALADFNRALELRPDDHHGTLYNVACMFSMTQHYQEALDWVTRAINGDAEYRSMAAEDPDFAPLRDHPQLGPQFRHLVAGDPGEPQ